MSSIERMIVLQWKRQGFSYTDIGRKLYQHRIQQNKGNIIPSNFTPSITNTELITTAQKKVSTFQKVWKWILSWF